MRVTVGHHMILMWHKLGEQKANFIPDLIGSFLELTLLRPRELRRYSLPLLLDMMKCEQFASGNFKRVCWCISLIWVFVCVCVCVTDCCYYT